MPIRRVEIERLVVEGPEMAPDDADRFRVALSDELARLLRTESAAVRSRDYVAIDVPRDTALGEQDNARVVAQSVARALTAS